MIAYKSNPEYRLTYIDYLIADGTGTVRICIYNSFFAPGFLKIEAASDFLNLRVYDRL